MVSSIALFAAIATARMQEPVTLKWDPKVGQQTEHQMDVTVSFDMGGMPGTVDFGFITVSKITKIEGDQVTSEGSMRDFKMTMNGQEMDTGDAAAMEAEKVVVVAKKNGEIISDSTPEEIGGGVRQQRMNAFIFPEKPIKIGDSWSQDFPADKELNLQSSKAKWTLVGSEQKLGYDTWKITNVWAEMDDTATGMSTMGTIWLRKSDGILVATEQKFENVSFQPGMPPMGGTAKMTLVSVKP